MYIGNRSTYKTYHRKEHSFTEQEGVRTSVEKENETTVHKSSLPKKKNGGFK